MDARAPHRQADHGSDGAAVAGEGIPAEAARLPFLVLTEMQFLPPQKQVCQSVFVRQRFFVMSESRQHRMTANISVAIALAGGFAMLLAASGSQFDPYQQMALVRTMFSGNKHLRNTTTIEAVQPKLVPPPADVVSLAWSNGVPVHS